MDARAEERLVRVDVADARDPLLREEEGLDRSTAALRQGAKGLGREVGAERLDPESARKVVLERILAEQHDARAEAARVREEDMRAVAQLEPHAQVRRCGALVAEQEVPGHPQVHDEEHLVLELADEVLAAAPEALDPPAGDGVLELRRRRRLAPARIEDVHPLEDPALERGRQMALDRLYLGQLGHYTRV